MGKAGAIGPHAFTYENRRRPWSGITLLLPDHEVVIHAFMPPF
jgi:hypothetical protein